MTQAVDVYPRNRHLPHDSTEIASVPPPDACDDETARRNAERIVGELLKEHAAAHRPPRPQEAPRQRDPAGGPGRARHADIPAPCERTQASPEAAVQAIVTGMTRGVSCDDGPEVPAVPAPRRVPDTPDTGAQGVQAAPTAGMPEPDIRAAIAGDRGSGAGIVSGPRGRRAALCAGVAVAALMTVLVVV